MFVLAYWLSENEQTLTNRILPSYPIYPFSCSFQDGPGNDHRLTHTSPRSTSYVENSPHRSDKCFLKAKRVYLKTSLTVKSNKSGFLSFSMSKLRNFETRFQARDTWPRVI